MDLLNLILIIKFRNYRKATYEMFEFVPDDLLIGTFWFKNKEILKYIFSLEDNDKESFIASSINKVVRKLKVYNFPVKYWLSLGTPKELNLAKYWFDYFVLIRPLNTSSILNVFLCWVK